MAQLGKKICLQCGRARFNLWVRKKPWRSKWQPTPVFLPGGSHGQRSLVGYSPWNHRVRHDWATNTFTRFLSLFMSYETYFLLYKFSKSFLFRDIKWYPFSLIFINTVVIIPASEDRLWELLGVNKKIYVTRYLLFISCKINMSCFFLSFPPLSLTVLMYLILYLGDPNLWDLMPDDPRWCWCDNNRDTKHNKCTGLGSFWNKPPTPLSVEKNLPQNWSLVSKKLLPKIESQLCIFLSKNWEKSILWIIYLLKLKRKEGISEYWIIQGHKLGKWEEFL